MKPTFAFYDARARESEAAAERADLAMVRDRELRSAAVWRGLANQARRIESDRVKAAESGLPVEPRSSRMLLRSRMIGK